MHRCISVFIYMDVCYEHLKIMAAQQMNLRATAGV